MPRSRFLLPVLALVALHATGTHVSLAAAERAAPAPSPAGAATTTSTSRTERVKQRVLRMTEFLDTMLPGVLEENNVTLHFTPKFSDVRSNEFVRFPLELRYGATENLELSAGVTPFTPNPFNSGRDHRWGPGEAKLGLRYDIGSSLPFFDDTTLGFETRSPLGKPPIEINDHYTHVKPFVSAARSLLAWPDVTFYANLSYDRSVKLTRRGPPPPEVMRRNVIEASPGLLYQPGELGYFAEYRWRHITQPMGWHIAHEVQFGSIWDVPKSRSEKWNLPGKVQIELAYKVGKEEGYDVDHGVSARVNWRTTLREVLTHTAKRSVPVR